MTALNCLMFFVSTLYFGISAVLIYLAAFLAKTYEDIDFQFNDHLADPVVILFFMACLTLILGIFGCCATARQSLPCFISFSGLAICVTIVTLAAAFLGFGYDIEAHDEIHKSIDQAINKYNGTNRASDKALDLLQNNYHCCGAVNASDWIESPYWEHSYIDEHNRTMTHFLPDSCCVDKKDSCKLTTGNFYTKGCSDQTIVRLQTFFQRSFSVCFGFAFLQIIGIILSCRWIGIERNVNKGYTKINGGTYI